MFGQQHYNAIAKVARESVTAIARKDGVTEVDQFLLDLCDYFQTDNENFDVERFLVQCDPSWRPKTQR